MRITPFLERFSALAALAGGLAAAGCQSAIPECACRSADTQGCSGAPELDYLLVEMGTDATLGQQRKVEISPTPAYEENRESVASAAIRLPERCSSAGAAQVTGESRETDTIVKTLCGTWLAELEKALVRARFRVVSWDSLHGLERSRNIPAYVAAKELGADILFLFNSLEASDVRAGGEASARFQYFRSDVYGSRGEPYPLHEEERAALRNFVRGKTQVFTGTEAVGVAALSSTLDSTAILTANGESVWFYRNTTLKSLREDSGARFLFAKYQNSWYPARREVQVVAPMQATHIAAEDVMQATYAAQRDPYASQRLDLVRMVANDFVTRFRSGQPGD
jgi:hypothetical protein